jgi:glycosyltransferase involved in cell wall biosynthesis
MKMKPSIINIQSFDYIHPFMTALVNLLGGVKDRLIISTWGSDIVPTEGTVSYWNKLSKRLLLSQAAEITSSSEFLASRASTIIGNPREIRIIPLGVNCEEFSPPNKRSRNNTIRISYIKHLKHKYGPDYLIKAMRIILDEHKNVELVMVGGGPLANCLEHMAQSLEISDKIQFTGFLPHENIPSVLADTDIFAMPTLMESLGVSALEAQAMEVPVVSTRVGGIPEAVVDGLTGILVAPKNEQQLADALIKLINDPGLRNQMGKAGRKHVLKNYEWNTILTKMEGLFTQVYQRSID